MNKKKVLAVLVIVLCLSVLGDVTMAYFTAKDTAHNVITTGNVDVELVEKQDQDGILVDYPSEPIEGVMPGMEVSKIVSVNNVGSGDAWVRIRITRTLEMNPDAPEALPEGEEPDLELIQIDCDEDAWVLEGEWYYCRMPVAPGKATAPLFKSVTFAPRMGNAYQGCTASILVEAQAVQVKNNPLPASGKYAAIPGWPAEKTEK